MEELNQEYNWKRTIHTAYFILFLVFIIMFFEVMMTIQHEEAHKQIYKYYGLNSTIHYKFFSIKSLISGEIAYTQADKGQNYSLCDESCTVLHSQNEIFGYQIDVIMLSLFVILILYVIYKELFRHYNSHF